MSTQLAPIEMFCSYAHGDEEWRRKLEKHLSPLQQQDLISLWHDRLIIPGTNWATTIDKHLESASVILLLVSADFFASDYCFGIEMKRALERQEANEAVVIPILVRPTEWQDAPFAYLQALPSEARPLASWEDEEQALADVVAGIRRVVENMPLLTASAPRAALPKIWNIPYPRNPFFLGRDQELSLIHQQLQRDPTALSQPQAISGMGGIGKTQLALEYAYCYHHEYQAVMWMRAESIEALTSSYSSVASLLQLPERDAREQEVIVQAVKKWLQNHRDWLLILDNADELALLPDFLPPTSGGHLLLTTRAPATGRLAHRLEIETLSPEQGALLLLRRAGLLDPVATLEQASSEQRELALRLCQDFGGLPLALDQAGAYLEETGIDLASYAQLYQQHRVELLNERRGLVSDHPAPVATTWSLSFERVKEKNSAAAQLLRMAAFLSPDAIPEELFTDGAAILDPVFAPVAADLLHFNQALEALRAYSLIRRNPGNKTLSLHRLVQAVLQDSLEEGERRHWAEQVILVVNMAFPQAECEKWPQCERLLAQARIAAQWVEQYQFNREEAARLLHEMATYLRDRGRYGEAEPLYQYAVRIREQRLGPEHIDLAYSLDNLAILYAEQRKSEEAEPFFQRALHIREQQLGPEHPSVATSLNNLANLYRIQGKYAEAETLYQRALCIREQQLGLEHPSVATSLDSLAILYTIQGKSEEAETLYSRALHIREQQLGPEHPSVATSLNNLAILYYQQGKYEEAEPFFQRALHIREQRLGLEHPNIAQPLNGLAIIYAEQSKYTEAEALFQRALHLLEQQRGREHPYVAYPLNGLANLYVKQGKNSEAEACYQRALYIREQQLGQKHPDTAETLHDYAAFQKMQGKRQEACSLYQRALAIREKALGPGHPETIATRQRLTALKKSVSAETDSSPQDDTTEWSGQPT